MSVIWSLGICFMFMMTKIRPYDGNYISELFHKIEFQPVDL